ncbi:N-acetyltransferase family protein [Falsibacillus pallidus]|uniref:GNAT family N-acetyltransferase n=1 Tax=Falsibacillus pallidus TaxID=493781 RepID=UPI003D95494A
MEIRHVESSDYNVILPVLNDWWGGRQMADMLPRLFFEHFSYTSFIIEEDNQIIGFLIGFLSQSKQDEAYIHFVGIHPAYRKKGIGQLLYHRFFEAASMQGRSVIRCVTSPINKGSIAFHTKMGFAIEDQTSGNSKDYDGPGQDRVRVMKKLS